jgi:delta(3,5)-delta(2,4)-dienoyl-CoA isomerase
MESKDEAVRKGIEMAKEIASKSPVAVQGTKTLLDYSRDHTIREGISPDVRVLMVGLEYTQLWNSIYLQTTVWRELFVC